MGRCGWWSWCPLGLVDVEHLAGGAAGHVVAVVAAPVVAVAEPGIGFGLELADGPEAAAVEVRAVLACQRATGAPPGDIAFSHAVLAQALAARGQGDEALSEGEAAVAQAQAAWGDRHSELAAALVARARARFARGRPGDEAAGRADLDRAERILADVSPAGVTVSRRLQALRAELAPAERPR